MNEPAEIRIHLRTPPREKIKLRLAASITGRRECRPTQDDLSDSSSGGAAL